MAKIKNVSGEDRVVPALGGRLVVAGGVVEVSDADVYGYTQQDVWEPVDDAAQDAHDKADQAYQALVAPVVTAAVDEPVQDEKPAKRGAKRSGE